MGGSRISKTGSFTLTNSIIKKREKTISIEPRIQIWISWLYSHCYDDYKSYLIINVVCKLKDYLIK